MTDSGGADGVVVSGSDAAAPVQSDRDLVIGISPFERPDAALVLGVARAGSLGALDLGRDAERARRALAELASAAGADPTLHFAARVPWSCPLSPQDLPPCIDTVILAESDTAPALWSQGGRRVLCEVRSLAEGRAAVAAGADALMARGSEGGGRIGEETAFVLLQRLLASLDLPVFVAGGIGVHSAAAALAGGAAGVVLDAQLALTHESSLGADVKAVIAAMDGGETAIVGGHRVFVRPDLPVASISRDAEHDGVAARIGGDDIFSVLIPAGQEARLASSFAARWRGAGAVVTGLRREVAAHLAAARRTDPLAPGSPLALAHGLRYPIAQGPMTRVSDKARFAAEVADAGGLPFIALSLLTGPESRALLEETAQLLGDRPFGAGILGFVPAEVRAAQLEALEVVRPPVALIAGGRPSQARPLEEAGIATYLHVPSPGLLQRFIHDGARRFVFEGRECGGHVGPRSSFALWDAQVETILASGKASEVSVLFAGGIHDARSAAMVSALAGPLAERGAKIGVLLGTAYLFTEEAVSAGAILPGFQRQALECEDTVLLETAPGHSTRCAATDYVRAFAAERDRMLAAGTEPTEMWAALEVLNLGRLRIASKGLVRRGDELVGVGEEGQRSEGMFMLGQVAALRSEVSTIARLHDDVSAGASALVADLDRSPAARAVAGVPAAPPPADVAIVGIACVFPGARDAAGYWSNLVAGVDAVTEVPASRWDPELYFEPDPVAAAAGGKTPSRWGGFLPDVAFDAFAYGIPPRSLASIEPVQLLSLEVATRALADAGYPLGTERELDRSRVSVVFGAEAGTELASAYGFRAHAPQYIGGLPEALDQALPGLTEDSFPGLLTNVIAGRIANRLDLGGTNFTVDAACASSLAAIDVAVKELRAGTSDMVLCGGADLHNGINDYLLFAATHALSPQGRCASFDASADGIALGEGVACVVLKRLEDARRDGDRVYAVVKSVAGASDGRSLGLTAPRPEGQRRALERAYAQARVPLADIGLLEAHGTGTVIGDRTELGVLTELFGEAGVGPASCALGSVKSQIGHTKCAAGLAGLIKAAMALHRGVLPPTIHLSDPNPAYRSGESPFAFHAAARPWIGSERAAGVSAFGFGGTNFHAVLTAAGDPADVPAHGLDGWPAELFLFRGETAAATTALVDRLFELVESSLTGATPLFALRDLAAATAAHGSGRVQAAIVAGDEPDLLDKLKRLHGLLAGEHGSGASQGVFIAGSDEPADVAAAPQVAFLFPGQGSQRPGMLSEIFVAFPGLRRHLVDGAKWAATMLPPTAFSADERQAQSAALTDTRVAQPALGIASLAVAELLAAAGVVPAMVAGHSYGELAALAVAGAVPADELLELSAARAEAILAAAGDDPGAMAAVSATAAEVLDALGSGSPVVVANDNSPRQVVISGPTAALEEASTRLTQAGLAVRKLPVACAFHSPVVASAAESFARRLADTQITTPRLPVWSNTTAGTYPEEADAVRSLLAAQLASPVRFREQVLAMHDAGARIFIEAGPGGVLSGLVGRILGDRPHRALAVDGGRSSLVGFLEVLAALATEGVGLDTELLFDGRATPFDLLADAPARPGWVVNGHLVRTADGDVVPGALLAAPEYASLAANLPVAAVMSPHAASPGATTYPNGAAHAMNGNGAGLRVDDARTAAVVEYLRGVRDTIAAGRDVMLAYLGAAPVEPARRRDETRAGAVEVWSGGNGHLAEVSPLYVGGAPTGNGHGSQANGSAGAAPNGHAAYPDDEAVGHGSGAAAPVTRQSLHDVVLSVVSERTGYPVDMLDPTLDLEAELSIDSIKRLEIVSELAERVGLQAGRDGAVDESVMEDLVKLKTLAGIVDWLLAASGAAGEASAAAAADDAVGTFLGGDVIEAASELAEGDDEADVPPSSLRLVPRLVEVPAPAQRPDRVAGLTVTVTGGDAALAEAVRGRLEACGATARVVGRDEPLGETEMLVHLEALEDGDGNRALRLFERSQEAVRAGARAIVAVSRMDGGLGMSGEPVDRGITAAAAAADGPLRFAGMRGVLKAIARELPHVAVRLVDLAPALGIEQQGAVIEEEILAGDSLAEVGRTRSARTTVSVVEEVQQPAPAPAGELLSSGAVVLVTGGARGITAQVVAELARRWRCRFVLVGRSPEPEGEEDPALAGAANAVELRRLLSAGGERRPAEIEAETRRLLAAREIRATMAAVRTAGGEVDYRCLDVRDAAAVTSLVEDVYRRHGRLDGVIHAAGVLEDARLVEKTVESFARVFDTKVRGAVAIADAVRDDLGFFLLFGSVSGIFGNRGQVDYAAANDGLAALARFVDRRLPGHVVTIDWGPWSGGGMVSPELEREFARRGVGLLESGDAIGRLLAELSSGTAEPEVVVMRAQPERFGWHADLRVAAAESPATRPAPATEHGEPAGSAPAIEHGEPAGSAPATEHGEPVEALPATDG